MPESYATNLEENVDMIFLPLKKEFLRMKMINISKDFVQHVIIWVQISVFTWLENINMEMISKKFLNLKIDFISLIFYAIKF